jgi:hypothetical protein
VNLDELLTRSLWSVVGGGKPIGDLP